MKLLLFDMDGTLVNSAAIILATQVEALRRHGYQHPGREAGLQVVGLTLDLALGVLIGSGKPEPELADTYKGLFQTMRAKGAAEHEELLYPGVQEGLAALHAREDVVLGIATGKSMRGYRYIAERYGWAHLFATVQTADTAPSKPHPGMILQAMAQTGIGPRTTCMIGDSNHDMEMAVAAGVLPIGVSWGFQPVEALIKAGARHIVTRFEDIAPILG